MFRITCDYCGEDSTYAETSERPDICVHCNTSLQDIEAVVVPDSSESVAVVSDVTEVPGGQLDGLKLTYKPTGSVIDLDHADLIVLGRANAGQAVLQGIPQISRRHCTIEYVDGKYLVTDAGSMHGTFVGEAKINCATNPRQELTHDGVLFLGQEQFQIELKYCETQEQVVEQTAPQLTTYRCKQCGEEFDERDDICSSCGTYDSMETLLK